MIQLEYVWLTTVGIYLMDSKSIFLLPNAMPALCSHLNFYFFVDDSKQSVTTVA